MVRRHRALGFVALVAGQLGLFAACTSTPPSTTLPPAPASPDAAPASASDAGEPDVVVLATDASPSGEDATASQDATTDLDAGAPAFDADAGEPDAGDVEVGDAGACNALVQLGAPVDALRTTGSHPLLDGGPLANGTYVLTEVSDFVEVPPSNVPFPYGSETLRIDGLHLEEVFTYPAGDVRRFVATLHSTGRASRCRRAAWSPRARTSPRSVTGRRSSRRTS